MYYKFYYTGHCKFSNEFDTFIFPYLEQRLCLNNTILLLPSFIDE